MKENYIKSLKLKNFTAFDEIEFEFSPGINVLIGGNSTGKTHVLKLLYCFRKLKEETIRAKKHIRSINDTVSFNNILSSVFMYEPNADKYLVNRKNKALEAKISIDIDNEEINKIPIRSETRTHFKFENKKGNFEYVYIPPKEILTHAEGLPEFANKWDLKFEEIYTHIIEKARHPRFKEPINNKHKEMLDSLNDILNDISKEIGGEVVVEGGAFYIEDEYGLLPFALLAEGYSKLGLLWQLIRNGSIVPGVTLFWDEPESNLNPKMLREVVKLLLELQRHEVQVFLATHNYVLLKEFDLQMKKKDKVMFHSLYREDDTIKVSSTNDYYNINPNVISETYLDIYERDVRRTFDNDDEE